MFEALHHFMEEIEARRGVRFDCGPETGSRAAIMDEGIRAGLARAADALGIAHVAMASGAGHDAAAFADAKIPVEHAVRAQPERQPQPARGHAHGGFRRRLRRGAALGRGGRAVGGRCATSARSRPSSGWFAWAASRRGGQLENTTQSAISARIAQLEQELGIRIFQRGERRVTLTAEGTALLRYAEQMVDLREDMLRAIADPAAMRGLLRIGISETLAHTLLPRLRSCSGSARRIRASCSTWWWTSRRR